MDSAFAWVFGKLWRRYLLCHIMLRNLYLGGFAFPQHSPSTFYRSHANTIKTVTNSTVREWASEGVSERARTQVSKSKFSFISGLQRKIPSSWPMHISRNEIRRWMFFFLISYRCWVDQKCVCACWWRIPGQRPLLRRKEAWWWNYQMQHSQMSSQVRMLICRGQLQLQSVPRFLKKFCPLNIPIFFYKYPGEGKRRNLVNEVAVVPGSSNQPLIIGRIRKRRFGPTDDNQK